MVNLPAKLLGMGPPAAAATFAPLSATRAPDPAGITDNFTLIDPRGKERTIRVFIPPSYAEQPRKKYPLLVMHDGQNLFKKEDSFAGAWRLGAALLDGLQSGNLREVIAVGIDNARDHKLRGDEYMPYEGEGQDVEAGPVGGHAHESSAWLRDVVLPEIERRYRVLPGKENRVIGGSSMAAVRSLFDSAMTDLFGGAILMSGTYWWAQKGHGENHPDIVDWIKSKWESAPPGFKIWMGVGLQERNYPVNLEMREAFLRMGFVEGETLEFVESPGIHGEALWARQINDKSKEGRKRYGPFGFFFPA